MQIDPEEIRPSEFYQHMVRIIVPRPIAWVSTQSADGIANVAPFSYFTGVGSNPPSVLFCPANRPDGTRKDTLRNIEDTGDFVINAVPFAQAENMNASAGDFPADESEFDACGLTAVDSAIVSAPRVAESPIQLECRLMQTIHLGAGRGGANVVIGRVVQLHIDDRILDDSGLVDSALLDAVGRLGGTTYCRTTQTFDLPRPQ
jgi:flavin reductase (DIM6/NTAB) family NADH-FMN oxidoreductase RutF